MKSACLVLYPSSTSALYAASILKKRGIRCEVIKPPASLTGGSCSYALSFDSRELQRIRATVDTDGGVYCRKQGFWSRV